MYQHEGLGSLTLISTCILKNRQTWTLRPREALHDAHLGDNRITGANHLSSSPWRAVTGRRGLG